VQRARRTGCSQVLNRSLDRTEAELHPPRQMPAVARQRQIATTAIEQSNTHVPLEGPQLLADGSVTNIQGLTRLNHISRFSKSREGP
jgi:hypothetical protein